MELYVTISASHAHSVLHNGQAYCMLLHSDQPYLMTLQTADNAGLRADISIFLACD